MSWSDEELDDEPQVPVVASSSQWDDEDASDELDDWDADPAEKEKKPKKLTQKQRLRLIDEKQQAKEAARRAKLAAAPMTKQQIAAAQKESDNKLMDDLFDGADDSDMESEDEAKPSAGALNDRDAAVAGGAGLAVPQIQTELLPPDQLIDRMVLEDMKDYKSLAEIVGARIVKSGEKKKQVAFLNSIIKAVSKSFTVDDFSPVKDGVQRIFNEKAKKRSAANKKKKGKKKGPAKLRVGAANDDYSRYTNDYDDFI